MRLFTFIRFMRQIMRKSPADLDWIQKQGLLAVKLAQIFALRSDLLTDEKCQQLQSLYQHAAKIPVEDVLANIEANAPAGFLDAFESIENEPLAAASMPIILPLLEEISPIISPINSSGTFTSISKIGSSKHGCAL